MNIPSLNEIEKKAHESAKNMQQLHGLPIRVAELVCNVEIDTAIRYIKLLTGKTPEYSICDGCRVLGNHEHRCHGNNIVVRGEFTDKKCECDFESCKLQQK